MKVYRVEEAERELKKRSKRYRDVPAAVEQFERLLAEAKIRSTPYTRLRIQRDGVPASIWKGKVIVPSLGGKQSGLRYIYETFNFQGQDYAVALMAYTHHSGPQENQVIGTIRDRFSKYSDTAALCLSMQL